MIKCHFVDTSEVFDPETGRGCDGGYGIADTMEIFVDERLYSGTRLRVALHEALELHCKGRIKHSKIDTIVDDLIGVLEALRDYDESHCSAKLEPKITNE
jgi:hypothetical protein